MLEIRVLGELAVTADGLTVEPPSSQRAWALLGWLALHPGDHARTAVATRFWPAVLDSSARQSLRSTIWALRRALGPCGEGALAVSRDRIGLAAERVWIDWIEWERALAAGDLERAVALCRGPLLADCDDDWAWEPRDEHRDALGEALGLLARRASLVGDHAAAVRWARRRVTVDPLAETATRELMRTLAGAGDRPAALGAYVHLCRRLASALHIAPSAQTRALAVEVQAEPAVALGRPSL